MTDRSFAWWEWAVLVLALACLIAMDLGVR